MEIPLSFDPADLVEKRWENGGSVTPDQLAIIITKRLHFEEVVELSSAV